MNASHRGSSPSRSQSRGSVFVRQIIDHLTKGGNTGRANYAPPQMNMIRIQVTLLSVDIEHCLAQSTSSVNRYGRFRDNDILRRCLKPCARPAWIRSFHH